MHDINLLKVMQAHSKSMTGGWYFTQVVGCRMKFTGAKNHSARCEELNTLTASSMDKDMKMTKKSKAKDTSDSEKKPEEEHFNC